MKVDLDALEATAKEMVRWEDENLASEQECMKCGGGVHTPSELEPTPLCNLCAQDVAGDMPALVARIRELETALTEAVGTIVGWVMTETRCDRPEDDGDWKTQQRFLALVEKGTTR